MASYQEMPYTLEDNRTAAPDAPLAAGHDQAAANEVAALEDGYLGDELVLAVTPGIPDATTTFSWGAKVAGEDYFAWVNWGDGVDELANNLGVSGGYEETHEYDAPGVYPITVTVYSLAGEPSLSRTLPIEVV